MKIAPSSAEPLIDSPSHEQSSPIPLTAADKKAAASSVAVNPKCNCANLRKFDPNDLESYSVFLTKEQEAKLAEFAQLYDEDDRACLEGAPWKSAAEIIEIYNTDEESSKFRKRVKANIDEWTRKRSPRNAPLMIECLAFVLYENNKTCRNCFERFSDCECEERGPHLLSKV